jgi:hypothetical protein
MRSLTADGSLLARSGIQPLGALWRNVRTIAAALGLLAAAGPAAAQCSMCRTVSAAQNAGVIDAAVVVLFVPAVAMFCGIFAVALRSGKVRSGAPRHED